MADEETFLGVSVEGQLAVIAFAGFVLVIASYSMSSVVDPNYNPTVFGIGIVCLAYAGLRLLYERLR